MQKIGASDIDLPVPDWVLMVWPKINQMTQNLSAQFICPSPKFLEFNEKGFIWASVVRVMEHCILKKVLIAI